MYKCKEQYFDEIIITAMRILERLGIQTCQILIREFKANFLFFGI